MFPVSYELRLKKQLSIQNMIQHNKIRRQHNDGRNQISVCFMNTKRPMKQVDVQCVSVTAAYQLN